MSQESLTWLNTQTLIGQTEKRGNAWTYRAELQGDESNHYPGFVPIEDVRRRLFNWHAIEAEITATALTPNGVITSSQPCAACAVKGYLEKKTSKCRACDGVGKLTGGFKAILRDDTGYILGVPKQGWQIHQYDEWLLHEVADLMDDDLGIASAGLLKNGRVAWVQIEMPDTIETPSGVKFRPFLGAATAFDGSLSTTYKRGVTNWVCDNTMAAGLGEAGEVLKVRHSKNSALKLQEARDTLALIHTAADDFAAEVEALTNTTVTDAQWGQFLDSLAPLKDAKGEVLPDGRSKTLATNKRNAVQNLWDNDLRVAPWKNTAWGVLQAVNTAEHHVWNAKGDRAQRNQLMAVQGNFEKLDVTTATMLSGVLQPA
jgi:phage/plasmid-like protein (TIGR03299 family)